MKKTELHTYASDDWVVVTIENDNGSVVELSFSGGQYEKATLYKGDGVGRSIDFNVVEREVSPHWINHG
jgi:hypothetical protein